MLNLRVKLLSNLQDSYTRKEEGWHVAKSIAVREASWSCLSICKSTQISLELGLGASIGLRMSDIVWSYTVIFAFKANSFRLEDA